MYLCRDFFLSVVHENQSLAKWVLLLKVVKVVKGTSARDNACGEIGKTETKGPLRWEEMRSQQLGRGQVSMGVLLQHLALFHMARESYWWVLVWRVQ